MSYHSSWKDVASIRLEILNKDFAYEFKNTRKRVHLLFVEGSTDRDFMHQFLTYDLKAEGIRLNIKKEKIHFCPKDEKSSNSKRVPTDDFNLLREGKNVEEEGTKRYHFDYVIDCIEFFMENKDDKLKHIDCFGMIDKDYFNHEIQKGHPVYITEMHDRETTIIRQYLVDYFNRINDDEKESCVDRLTEVIDFCFRQGILANSTVKLDSKYVPYFRWLTITKLKNISNKENLVGFDLLDFLDRSIDPNFKYSIYNYSKDYDFELNEEQFEDDLELLKKNYSSYLSSTYNFETELNGLLKRLLIYKNPFDDKKSPDVKRLDRIFKFINGHIFINQLRINNLDFFGISSSNEFDKYFIERFSSEILERNPDELYKLDPFASYKKYRIEKGYFTKI